jgi:hypothetical protein
VAEEAYFLDGSRNQQGPVPIAEIARLIRSGTIRRDTLVWYAGMPEWRPAGQVSEFASLFVAAAPPPRPPGGAMPPQAPRPAGQSPRFSAGAGDRIAPQGMAPQGMAPQRMVPQSMAPQSMDAGLAGAAPTDALVSHLGVWGLFWRVLVALLGAILLIPTPWTTALFYRYIVDNTWLPSGRRLTFTGTGGDIWYVFIGGPIAIIAIAVLLGLLGLGAISPLFTIPASGYMSYLIICWLVEKVGSDDGSVQLKFTGSFWGVLGWSLLLGLSFLTIIGWAWAMKFFFRWLCRNVSGTLNFDFVGTGWGILWRIFVIGLLSNFLIPIPWLWRWYTAWFIGQIRTGDLATHFD